MTKVPAIFLDFSTFEPIFKVAPVGKNAETDPDSDMLLAIDNRPAQIIQSGTLYIGAGATESVTWPFALNDVPLIEFQSSWLAGQVLVPFHLQGTAYSGIYCTPSTTGADFVSVAIARYVTYVALARSLS